MQRYPQKAVKYSYLLLRTQLQPHVSSPIYNRLEPQDGLTCAETCKCDRVFKHWWTASDECSLSFLYRTI